MKKQTIYYIGVAICLTFSILAALIGDSPVPYHAAAWVCWALGTAAGNETVPQ